jgi:hypothetical protein
MSHLDIYGHATGNTSPCRKCYAIDAAKDFILAHDPKAETNWRDRHLGKDFSATLLRQLGRLRPPCREFAQVPPLASHAGL